MKENELKIQKTKKERLKEIYLKYQMLKQQLNALNSQKSLIEKNIELIRDTIENMKEINSAEENRDILSSIGNGAYVKAELKDSKNVIIEIGGDVMVEKPIPQAISILDNRLDEMRKMLEEINKQMTIFQNEIVKVEREIVQMSGGSVGKG